MVVSYCVPRVNGVSVVDGCVEICWSPGPDVMITADLHEVDVVSVVVWVPDEFDVGELAELLTWPFVGADVMSSVISSLEYVMETDWVRIRPSNDAI